MEYTEMISHVPNESARREVWLGKDDKLYYSDIVYVGDDMHNVSRASTLEQALIRCFTGGSPAWFREEMTFRNLRCYDRILRLIDKYKIVKIKIINGQLALMLGDEKKPETGDYGHIQDLTRYAIGRMNQASDIATG